MMMVTYDGNIWYPSLYDLDSTFGTWCDGTLSPTYSAIPDNAGNNLWNKILKCFPNDVANRYFELRKTIFTKENIMKEFNDFISIIPEESYKKDANRWKNMPGYEISQVEEFLDYRLPYIDEIMYNKYNIVPEVSIEYSKMDKTDKFVAVTLNKNRSDITIFKDGKETNDYIYTFNENGTYTFQYQDWYGNQNEITAKVDNIGKNEEKDINESDIINILVLIISTTIVTVIVLIIGINYYIKQRKDTKTKKYKKAKRYKKKEINSK